MLLRLGVGEELVFPDSAVPCAGDALELVALERGMDVSLGHALGEGLVELIDIIAVVVVAVVLRAGPLAGKQKVGICYADAVRIGIELTDEELDEIFADDDFDNGEEDGEIRSFHFSNPDPYAKVKPRPDDAPKREFSFDEKGNIVVKNPSAFWLPDVKIVEEHGGTEYTVTGSYEGTETLDKKLRRIMEQNAADDKSSITEDADE